MIRPCSSASDPGSRHTPTVLENDTDIGKLTRAPRKKSSFIVLLGPHPKQRFVLSDDDSDDSVHSDDGDDDDADDEHSSPPELHYSPPASPSPLGHTDIRIRAMLGGSQSPASLQEPRCDGELQGRALRRVASDDFDQAVLDRGAAEGSSGVRQGAPYGSFMSERGACRRSVLQVSGNRRQPPHSYRPARSRHLHDDAPCAYPILASPENSLLWSQTQPTVELEVLIRGAEESPHVDWAVQREILLDELLAESPPPAYSSTVLPRQCRSSARPTLPTINSGRAEGNAPLYRPPATRALDARSAPAPTTPYRSRFSHTAQPFVPRARATCAPDPLCSDDDLGHCDACARPSDGGHKMMMVPCQHIVCANCFGSAIAAVSAKRDTSKCTSCLAPVTAFKRVDSFSPSHSVEADRAGSGSGSGNGKGQPSGSSASSRARSGIEGGSGIQADESSGASRNTTDPTSEASSRQCAKVSQPVVLRIDNVAWDITPAIVMSFLPANTIAINCPSPIHILLDRTDGRTRDYLYVELASVEASRQILQTKQNALMPCGPLNGGRTRAVTASLVSHDELLDELRPHSAAELDSRLTLCQAAVTIPYLSSPPPGFPHSPVINNGECLLAPSLPFPSHNRQQQQPQHHAVPVAGAAHFVKNRHGPFYALMSILSKLGGRKSPAYWDLYRVASGAIAALASAIDRDTAEPVRVSITGLAEDKRLLGRLRELHAERFSHTSPSTP